MRLFCGAFSLGVFAEVAHAGTAHGVGEAFPGGVFPVLGLVFVTFPAISSILFNAPRPSNAPIQPKNPNFLNA